MTEQEIVRFVPFENRQVVGLAVILADPQDVGESALGVFFGDERLVLNQTAGAVRFFPVWYIIQQEMERSMWL